MIIGIDIGTQSLKTVVVTDDLQVKGDASQNYEIQFPKPGWAEQPPDFWEKALGPTIHNSLNKAGVHPSDVKALGIVGQIDGCVVVDHNNNPLSSCLIWMDRRAEPILAGISGDKIRIRTGVNIDPSHMAAKICWLQNNIPSRNLISKFHQPVSYMVARLTGQSVIDHATASTTMLYSLKQQHYDSDLLNMFGVEIEQLPEIKNAWNVAGFISDHGSVLSGLPKGIPVAVGTGDDFSNIIGAGQTKPGRLISTIGTAEVVGALSDSLIIDPQGLVETHSYISRLFFIENPGWSSGGTLSWFLGLFGLKNPQELDQIASEKPPASEGLLFIPALTGAMAPEWIPTAKGCFYGLTPAHGLGHMARAILEGCAFAMRDVAERLIELNVPLNEVLLLGGGAKSRLWGHIRADVCNLPVIMPRSVDTSPLAGAMLALVASGIVPNISSCVSAAEIFGYTIDPDQRNREHYDNAYHNYHRLFKSLRPMF